MSSTRRPLRRTAVAALLALLLPWLAGCASNPVKTAASYPTKVRGTDKILYSDEKRETMWGNGVSLTEKLTGGADKEDGSGSGSAGIGVNSFLWRASLDTVSFMPLASADPFGGVILTDWYENPDAPGERFKVNVYIMDKHLRADGVRVSVFRQEKKKSAASWQDAKVADKTAADIENTILTRARELRVAAAGAAGKK